MALNNNFSSHPWYSYQATPTNIDQTQIPIQPVQNEQRYSLIGLGQNALNNINQIGTGLTHLWVHTPEYLAQGRKDVTDYLKNVTPAQAMDDFVNFAEYVSPTLRTARILNPRAITPELVTKRSLGGDIYNAVAEPYGATIEDIKKVATGERTIREAAKYSLDQMYENPFYVGLDLIPLAGKPLSSAVKGLSKTGTQGAEIASKIIAPSKVEKGILTSNATAAQKAEGLMDDYSKFTKSLPEEDLVTIIKAREEGLELPTHLETKAKEMDSLTRRYQEVVPDYAKVDTEDLAVTQYVARKTGKTFQEAKNIVTGFDNQLKSMGISPDEIVTNRPLSKEVVDNFSGYQSSFKRLTGENLGSPIIDNVDETLAKFLNESGATGILNNTVKSQAPDVIEALGRVLEPEEFKAVQDLTLRDALDAITAKYPEFGYDAVNRILEKSGIKHLKDIQTGKTTNIKLEAGYEPTTGTIRYLGEDIVNRVHEPMHWFLDKLRGAAARNPELDKLLNDLYEVDYKSKKFSLDNQEEALVKNWTDFFVEGKIPKNQAQLKLFKSIKREMLPDVQELDSIGKAITEGRKLFKEGKIFPVPHAMDVADAAADAINLDWAGRLMAGRFSSREFGLTDYPTLAKALGKTEDWLPNQIQRYAEDNLAKEIIERGTVGGESVAPLSKADTVFIDKDLATAGKLKSALNTAKTESELANVKDMSKYVPVDKNIVGELKTQLYSPISPLTGVARDLNSIFKSTLLSQGTYLAGNAITGAANIALDSGVNLIGDIVSAIGTKGKLAKNLGIYRRDIAKKLDNPTLQKIRDFNMKTGGDTLRFIDRGIQNTIAEVAANAQLRKAGVRAQDRLSAIGDIAPKKLGQLISDTKKVALLNSTRTVLPRGASQIISTVQPFWQWYDTAAQSSYYMLKNNPAMANVALVDILSNIGLDKEYQLRNNLKVESSRPFVTYKADPNTNKIREYSAEFVPMMNTLKFASDAGMVAEGREPSAMLMPTGWGEIIQAARGKSTYDRPLQNKAMIIQGDKRYKYDQNRQRWIEVQGGTPSEVLTAIVRNTIGIPNMVNKTILPATTGIINALNPEQQLNFYRPYPNQLFGEIATQGQMPVNANPTSQRTGVDVVNSLRSIYSKPYYPEKGIEVDRMQTLRQLMRAAGRRNQRIQESINE